MDSLWANLAPLVVASALVPIQIVVTFLLLRSPTGTLTAAAWVGGMSTVRLTQGIVFGLILGVGATAADESGPGLVLGTLLLVLGVVFLAMAARTFFTEEDPDAPPPNWMKMTDTMTPGKAFLFGAGLMVVGVKFWVLTLSAVGAIAEAELSRGASVVAFVVFVILAQTVNVSALAMSTVAPSRSQAVLDRAVDWLSAKNRVIVIMLGLVFGSWFVMKALRAFGFL